MEQQDGCKGLNPTAYRECVEALKPFVKLWEAVKVIQNKAGFHLQPHTTLSAHVLTRTPGFAFKVKDFEDAQKALADAQRTPRSRNNEHIL